MLLTGREKVPICLRPLTMYILFKTLQWIFCRNNECKFHGQNLVGRICCQMNPRPLNMFQTNLAKSFFVKCLHTCSRAHQTWELFHPTDDVDIWTEVINKYIGTGCPKKKYTQANLAVFYNGTMWCHDFFRHCL